MSERASDTQEPLMDSQSACISTLRRIQNLGEADLLRSLDTDLPLMMQMLGPLNSKREVISDRSQEHNPQFPPACSQLQNLLNTSKDVHFGAWLRWTPICLP